MTVSIIIPCHNGQDFIADAIASAMAQTHRDIEIVVIDDASTDESGRIIRQLAAHDPRIKAFFLETNVGAAAARNSGISLANGEWVAFLDADDLYEADRIEQLLKVAAATDAEIVMDRQHVRDFSTDIDSFLSFEFLAGSDPIVISPELYFLESSVFHREPNIGYMKPMFRRRYLLENGLGFDEKYKVGEDISLQIECICRGARLVGTPYAGYIYRRRPASLSREDAAASTLRPLAAMCDEILERHGTALSKTASRLIRKRKRILERFIALSEFAAAARAGAFGRCCRIAVRRPDMLLLAPILVRKWSARLSRRLRSGRTQRDELATSAAG